MREVAALAHRGAHGPGAPENTLPALLAAVALGYRWVETDLRASADGVLVLAHDPTLARTAGSDLALATTGWPDLSAVDLAAVDLAVDSPTVDPTAPSPGAGAGGPSQGGGPVHLLRLEEALDAVPGAHLNIDVKAPGAVAPLVDLLARRPELARRVRVTSFSERRRAAVLRGLRSRGAPAVASSASAPLTAGCAAVAAAPLPRPVRVAAVRALARATGLDSLQVPEAVALPRRSRRGGTRVVRVLTPRLREVAHAAGLAVHVWVVDAEADMQRLLDAGVDGLVTDRAPLLAEVLAARGQWPPGPARPGPATTGVPGPVPASKRSPR